MVPPGAAIRDSLMPMIALLVRCQLGALACTIGLAAFCAPLRAEEPIGSPDALAHTVPSTTSSSRSRAASGRSKPFAVGSSMISRAARARGMGCSSGR